MQFGKLPNLEGLSPADFAFPPTHIRTARTPHSCATFVGGTTWNIPEWVGQTYPTKTPRRSFPAAYAKQFGTIEFNATHYKIYAPEKMKEWADAMPVGFQFCAKFPQLITHFRRFQHCEGPTDDFIAGLLALGNKRGPTFIQLPPHFAPAHAEAMWRYLELWPRELSLSVEFRHPDWFGSDFGQWEHMAALGIGAVISDTAGRRDALHMRVTAPHVLVRFGGYEGHPLDRVRLESWCRWIEQHEAQGVASFHLLVHEPDSLYTPTTCREFVGCLAPEKRKTVVAPRTLTENPNQFAPTLF